MYEIVRCYTFRHRFGSSIVESQVPAFTTQEVLSNEIEFTDSPYQTVQLGLRIIRRAFLVGI